MTPRKIIRILRGQRLAIACLAIAALVGIAANVDHVHKQHVLNRVEVDNWYCRHHHTRCGAPSWHRIEARWQTRQLVYEGAVIALGGGALVRIGYAAARGFRRRTAP